MIENLLFEYPDCTVCDDGGDMNTDGDSWWCEDCGTYWDRNGERGASVDEVAP